MIGAHTDLSARSATPRPWPSTLNRRPGALRHIPHARSRASPHVARAQAHHVNPNCQVRCQVSVKHALRQSRQVSVETGHSAVPRCQGRLAALAASRPGCGRSQARVLARPALTHANRTRSIGRTTTHAAPRARPDAEPSPSASPSPRNPPTTRPAPNRPTSSPLNRPTPHPGSTPTPRPAILEPNAHHRWEPGTRPQGEGWRAASALGRHRVRARARLPHTRPRDRPIYSVTAVQANSATNSHQQQASRGARTPGEP